jgi:5-carboxymethyl-2-hydroxymuconate isomerase
MPHFILEYSANLEDEADIDGLLAKVNAAIIAQGPVFPIGGIRSRAYRAERFRVADGAANDAFVHANFRIGAGRDAATRQRAGDALFEVMKAHFADLQQRRALALSLEVTEFPEPGTWKHNNIHARFGK